MEWSTWSILVVVAVIAERTVAIVSDGLAARAARRSPPARLATLYGESVYRRSQDHARSSARADMLESTVELVAIVAFVALGGFAWLDGTVRDLGLASPWLGVVFVGVLVLLEMMLQTPLSLWRTFVLEARFDLNRTTPRTFVLDTVKSLALLAIIGIPLTALVILFFERTGPHGWWLTWLVLTLFTFVAQLVVPRFVLPLFLRFEPLEDGDLRRAIESWAARTRVTLDGLFMVDGSRRSTRANAFVTGIGGATRIALFDTLIASMKEREVVAVLAHEVGHRRLGHIRKGLALGIVQSGAMLFLFAQVLRQDALFHAFGIVPSVAAGLAIFGLLLRPVSLLLGALGNAQSRRHEFEADAFAARTTERQAMVGALEAIGRDNLANLTPHPVAVALYESHPPLAERIQALEASA